MWPRTFLAAVQVYCCIAGTVYLTVPVTRFDDRGRAAVAGTAYAASTGGTTALMMWPRTLAAVQLYCCTVFFETTLRGLMTLFSSGVAVARGGSLYLSCGRAPALSSPCTHDKQS